MGNRNNKRDADSRAPMASDFMHQPTFGWGETAGGIKFFGDWDAAWHVAIQSAENGDDDTLRKLLLDYYVAAPIPLEARTWLWELAAGRVKIKRPRGMKSRLVDQAKWIQVFFKSLINPDAFDKLKKYYQRDAALMRALEVAARRRRLQPRLTKGEAEAYLAKRLNVSKATIRDLIAKRNTFAEK